MKLWQSLLISFFLASSIRVDAFSLEFSHLVTDDQSQLAIYGQHKTRLGNGVVSVGGRYVKSSSKPKEFRLGGNGRFQLHEISFFEVDAATYHTHDSASLGLGVNVVDHIKAHLSVSGAYSREYESTAFDSFLQGPHEDLLRITTQLDAWMFDRDIAFEFGHTFIQNYDSDRRRSDGYARMRASITAAVYIGLGFERVRFVDSYRSFIGVKF